MFNNVFAIKEVIDSESFDDNHRVLKEVVELLHSFIKFVILEDNHI